MASSSIKVLEHSAAKEPDIDFLLGNWRRATSELKGSEYYTYIFQVAKKQCMNCKLMLL